MLNVKKMLTKIANSLTSLVVIKDYSYAYSNLSGSTSLTITAEQMNFSTPSGYTPVGVLTVDSGHAAVELERVSGYLDNKIRNVSGSTQSGTYAMRVVYVKVGGGGTS